MAAMEYTLPFSSLLLVLLLVLSGGLLSAANPVVELVIQPPGDIEQGDNVSIICTAEGKDFLDVIRIVRSIDGNDYEIGTNGVAGKVYERTGRYIPSYKEEDNTGVFELTITDIQGSDGGNIGCKVLGRGDGAYEDLIVRVPPKSVTLKYLDQNDEVHELEEGMPIKLQHGTSGGIICEGTVEGSDIEPKMQIKIGDEDITDKFTKEYESDNSHEAGFQTLFYHKTLTYRMDSPDIAHDGKMVECSSTMDKFDPITASAGLEILYAPTLDCETKYYKKLGEEMTFECEGGMNPSPLEFSFSWGKKPNRTTLYEGDEEDGFIVTKQDLGANRYKFILTLDEVMDHHFGKYKLLVTNDIGVGDITITMREEEETTTSTTTTNTTPIQTQSENPQGKPDPDLNQACENLTVRMAPILMLAFISFLISRV